MAVAFLFPGQASQFVGMGKDLYEASPEAKAVYDRADDVLGFSLTEICFSGPEDSLKQTAVTQPAVFTHSMAGLELLKLRGVKPDAVAGHSVGELAALVGAGVLGLEDGLHLVRARGKAMQEAGEAGAGTMAAVLGLDDGAAETLCAKAAEGDVLQAANFNCPGQVVISGGVDAVRRAVEAAKAAGARRALELPVSGAFHSALMAPALVPLQEALEAVVFHPAVVPVYPNVTGEPTQDPEVLKDLLLKQLTSSVQWTASMGRMTEDGITRAYEIGPGATLKGLMKRVDASVEVRTMGTWEEIREAGEKG